MNEKDFSSGWEKCARTISLNTRAEIFDLLNLLGTICLNITTHPTEPKYRTIKLNNKTILDRLLSRKGGLEFLQAVGFKSIVVDAVRTLQLDVDDADSDEKMDEITDSLSWLTSTVDTCVQMADNSNRRPDESCAECTIQLRLPTGVSVAGGFVHDDLASAVLSFASCFFRPEKADSVSLRHAHNATEALTEEELESDLKGLKLFPRAVLIVSVLSEDNRAGSLLMAQKKVSVDIKKTKEKAEKLRKEKLLARKVLNDEKERTLNDFKGDRQDQKARVFAVKNDDKIDTKEVKEVNGGKGLLGGKSGQGGLGGQN